MLATLGELARVGDGRLLAAGDFNESLDFDLRAGETPGMWGKEYFDRARAAGPLPWLHEQWGDERPTHKDLQLDHVLVTEAALPVLSSDPTPELDEPWPADGHNLSDHTPIWVALSAPL